jgi:hypothetical protein
MFTADQRRELVDATDRMMEYLPTGSGKAWLALLQYITEGMERPDIAADPGALHALSTFRELVGKAIARCNADGWKAFEPLDPELPTARRARESQQAGVRAARLKADQQFAADVAALREWATEVIAQDPRRRRLPFGNRTKLLNALQSARRVDCDTVAATLARKLLRPGFPTSAAQLYRLLGALSDDELKPLLRVTSAR